MKQFFAAFLVVAFAASAFAADLVEYPPARPVLFQDGGKQCQRNAECQSGFCLASEGASDHGQCREKKFPGFGCLKLYDKDKGAYEYCAD